MKKITFVEVSIIVVAIVLTIVGIGTYICVDKVSGTPICIAAGSAWVSAALICPSPKYF